MVPLVWDIVIGRLLGATGRCDQQVPRTKDDRTIPIPTSMRDDFKKKAASLAGNGSKKRMANSGATS
jgi:hypothetical protein